jgi:hypothetical protein
VTDVVDGILNGKRYLIHDRDPLLPRSFKTFLTSASIKCVKLAPQSSNLNAHAGRLVRSIKESCLDRLILVLRKNSIGLKSPIITAILTKSGGISPSILMMQTTEYRFRKYQSSLGYGFHLAVCRRFLLNLIGNTGS